MIHISNKKYLRKNEFRYNTGKDVKRPDGEGHVVYVSARQGHKFKYNVITHSDTFFNEPTHELCKNPEIASKDKRKSKFSSPRWGNDIDMKDKAKGVWRFNKKDKIKIKKFNKKYKGNYSKTK